MMVPTDELGLAQALTTAPNMEIEFEQVVAHSDDATPLPTFWAEYGNFERFEQGLAADSTVKQHRRLNAFDGCSLYAVQWADQLREFLHNLLAHDLAIVSVTGNKSAWRLTLRFPTQTALSVFHDFCRNKEITLTPERVSTQDSGDSLRFALTDAQQEALVCAYDNGYFEIPRQVTTADIGELLGISANSASQRLRRALETVVASTFIQSPTNKEYGN